MKNRKYSNSDGLVYGVVDHSRVLIGHAVLIADDLTVYLDALPITGIMVIPMNKIATVLKARR